MIQKTAGNALRSFCVYAAVRPYKPHSGVFILLHKLSGYSTSGRVCGVITKGAGASRSFRLCLGLKNRWSARCKCFSSAPAQYLARDFAELQRVGGPARFADGHRGFLPAGSLCSTSFCYFKLRVYASDTPLCRISPRSGSNSTRASVWPSTTRFTCVSGFG